MDMKEALNLPMQDWFKRRFPLFFEPGTFEVSFVWLADTDETLEATIKSYGV